MRNGVAGGPAGPLSATLPIIQSTTKLPQCAPSYTVAQTEQGIEHVRSMRGVLATAIAAAMAFALPVGAAAAPAASPLGTWLNPYGSVAVRTGACGDRLCGWVVWASADAQADAREGGVTGLIGTQLLENYRPASGGWVGTVFVPDMGRRFYSKIEPVGSDGLRVKGCILHGLVCRSQLWHRVAQPPHA